jgi:hypothetical protein
MVSKSVMKQLRESVHVFGNSHNTQTNNGLVRVREKLAESASR